MGTFSTRIWVYILLVLTNLIWGSTWVVGRLLAQEVPPITASALRFALACVALGGLLLWREGRIPRLPKQDAKVAFGLGLTGIFLYSICFLTGLKFTTAGRGALIVALNPVMIALAAWLFFGEAMSWLKALGIVLALTGCIWVVGNGHPQNILNGELGWGELLILGCVIAWAVYTFISRRASGSVSGLAMNFYGCATGCALLGVTSLLEHSWAVIPHIAGRSWLFLIYLAFFATALSYTWYLNAVKVLGAGRAAIFTNITPLSGVAFGAMFIHERLPLAVLMGGLVTVSGVLLALYADQKQKNK